jgi:4'-phosphopantetheinyl transferase EntD
MNILNFDYLCLNFGSGKILAIFETMPIFFQQDIDKSTRLAIWKLEEPEEFFLKAVPLQREITHPHKRLQHLAGRWLLKYLFPAFPLELIRIADTRKPFLENEAFHFSISHCGDFAAVIVSENCRVGVDIEIPSHKVERIKHKFLHREELELLQLQEMDHIIPLTLMWSCKEAVFKWWSYGNVDFSDQIRLSPPALQGKGLINACFIEKETFDLSLHYSLFNDLCLAWVSTGF